MTATAFVGAEGYMMVSVVTLFPSTTKRTIPPAVKVSESVAVPSEPVVAELSPCTVTAPPATRKATGTPDLGIPFSSITRTLTAYGVLAQRSDGCIESSEPPFTTIWTEVWAAVRGINSVMLTRIAAADASFGKLRSLSPHEDERHNRRSAQSKG